MEVKFDVKMTQKIMYNFLLSHTYKSFSGVFGVLFGAAALAVFAMTFEKVESWQSILYLVFGIWFILYLPITLYLKSVKQVKLNPVFKKPITYILNDEGIQTIQDDQNAELKWEDLVKVTETKLSLLVYTGKRYSFVFPKESIGEQYDELLKLIQGHVDAGKIKIKSRLK
ncbi:YcxB family protein [uncultured Robinsoniella sp.]|uniref:YcxB family protein n=1 Tax=uncultured Robinsoniella sp. TaxID=904190 RepID=UPI00374E22E8